MTDLLPLKLYQDLCREIGLIYDRLDDLKRERKYYWKMCMRKPGDISGIGYDEEKVSHNFTLMPLDRAYEKIYRIDSEIEALKNILAGKELTKRNMEKRLSEFDGLDYQVGYLRTKGYSIREIAAKLSYSERYIKNISSKVRRGRLEKL